MSEKVQEVIIWMGGNGKDMTERVNKIKDKKDRHVTVLLDEAVESLDIQEGDVIIDATLGAGGHTLKILEKIGRTGNVIAFDLDKQAIEEFIDVNGLEMESMGNIFTGLEGRLILVNDNFKNIQDILDSLYARGGIKIAKVDGILADLGWRIEQIQDERYGMSFQSEMTLDMRMSPETQKLTAREIINEWGEEELADIFRELGGEAYFDSKKIAKKIIDERVKGEINSTIQLVELITGVKANIKVGINPATKVFQALRITVNKELSNLNIFLESSFDGLKSKGRLVVISFHSLEDRLVKKFFRAKARGCVCPKELPMCVCHSEKRAKVIRRRAIKESDEVLKDNPRARSARMRVLEKK